MILKKTALLSTALIAVAVSLSACGGGGGGGLDDGQTPLRTEPQNVTLNSATTSCPPAEGVTVFVFGGVAPYTLRNTVPNNVSLSTPTVANAGEGVRVRFLGGCLATIPLVVVDKNGTTTSVSLTYNPATQ